MFPLKEGGGKIKCQGMQIVGQEAASGDEHGSLLRAGREEEIKVGQKFSKQLQKSLCVNVCLL